MDKVLLKRKAEALETMLQKHEGDPLVASLRGGLRPFLQRAKEQTIDAPLEWRYDSRQIFVG